MTEYKLPDNVTSQTGLFMQAVLKKLTDSGAIEDCDSGSLFMLAVSYDMYVRASETLLSDGPFQEDAKGRKSPHPAVKLHSMYYAQVLAWMRENGMTVRSRERIKALTPPVDADNELANFLKQ